MDTVVEHGSTVGGRRGPCDGACPQAAGRARACSVGAVHVVIMGCGRVGSTLAHSLESQGTPSRSSTRTPRVPPARPGLRGHAGHRLRLRPGHPDEAGIEQAYAFAAVCSGDNSNIIAARVARETFGVEHVVARIYDPGRAEVYQRLGIPTVATVRWTADQMLRRLLPAGRRARAARDPTGRVVLAEVPAAPRVGRPAGSPSSRRRPAPGSRSSPGSARASCPHRTRCSRRATCCTS